MEREAATKAPSSCFAKLANASGTIAQSKTKRATAHDQSTGRRVRDTRRERQGGR